MDRALELAAQAAAAGEVPVGAVIVLGGEVIGEGRNETVARNDPTAHAEIVAIRTACERLQSQRLTDCELHVTLEPCAMCAAAISFARVERLYFGAEDPKSGGVLHGPRLFQQSTCHHAPQVYSGISESAAGALLRDFFSARR